MSRLHAASLPVIFYRSPQGAVICHQSDPFPTTPVAAHTKPVKHVGDPADVASCTPLCPLMQVFRGGLRCMRDRMLLLLFPRRFRCKPTNDPLAAVSSVQCPCQRAAIASEYKTSCFERNALFVLLEPAQAAIKYIATDSGFRCPGEVYVHAHADNLHTDTCYPRQLCQRQPRQPGLRPQPLLLQWRVPALWPNRWGARPFTARRP